MTPAIETRALRKVYRVPAPKKVGPGTPPGAGEVVALDGLDLAVRPGEFFGLLGPNGAGKTTTLGILTTRVAATSGEARIDGEDVTTSSVAVRRRIGVVPQRPNPDRSLSAYDNLIFHAAYYGVPKAAAHERASALLAQFDIADKRDRKVDELSGGQQQRLMIARALIHEPAVIFLDEPTVGLDPQARLALWDVLRGLHAQGRTIVMTTHYMEEADQLCDRVAIIDNGRLLALDTPAALKARAPGGTLIEITLDGDSTDAATHAARIDGVERAEARDRVLRAYADRGGAMIPALLAAAESSGRQVQDIHLVPPSLETLFISLTGRKLA
jgi:ABC-2 type transport system ATP-binding protein